MTVAATLAGAVSMLANLAQWGLLLGGGRGAEDGDEAPSPACRAAAAGPTCSTSSTEERQHAQR